MSLPVAENVDITNNQLPDWLSKSLTRLKFPVHTNRVGPDNDESVGQGF